MPFKYSLNSLIIGSPRDTHLRIGRDIPAELLALNFKAVFLWYWRGTDTGYYYEGIRSDSSNPASDAVLERGYVDLSGASPVVIDTGMTSAAGAFPVHFYRDGVHYFWGNSTPAASSAALVMQQSSSLTFMSNSYLSANSTTYINLPSMEQVDSGLWTGDYSFTSVAYTIAVTAGVHTVVGLTFVAPASGKGVIHMRAQLLNTDATRATFMAPEVREGAVVGAGTVHLAAADSNAMVSGWTSANPGQSHVTGLAVVDGLSAGDTYNVRLLHRVNAATGRTLLKRMVWIPSF
jgi:hypothetical protein